MSILRRIVLCIAVTATTLSGQSVARTAMANSPKQGGAAPTADGRRVTLNLRGVTLKNALEEIARQSGVAIATFDNEVLNRTKTSLQVSNATAIEASTLVLRGTEFQVRPSGVGRLIVSRSRPAGVKRVQGTVTGKVTDGKTGRAIGGATVSFGNETRGVMTAEDGSYKLVGASEGTQIVSVRMMGYTKQSQTISIAEGATVTANFAMEPTANVLDQMVVTGTIIQTELKAVPSAITVVTAKQIEERGITRIDQLFRGDVPGLFAMNMGTYSEAAFDEVSMFSRGATALNPRSAGANLAYAPLTTTIKTYVDGVELTEAKYLSQIDPRSIERIEILTGPQATTIYGSNAINGVMQIFTKRGTTNRPLLTLNLMSGWIENNFSNARTPQHDHSAQLSGVEGRLSYNAGGTWYYMGPWTPAKQSTRTDGFGGARLELRTPVGRVTSDVTLRRSVTQNVQHGPPIQQFHYLMETGWYGPTRNATPVGVARPETRVLAGQTLGLNLSYVPVPWWLHEVNVGTDVSSAETRVTARGYTTLSDTAVGVSQSNSERRSLRYTNTATIPIGTASRTTITAGLDAWQKIASSWSVSSQTLTGSLAGSTTVSRQPGHNAGGFVQGQVGLYDRLFLTYGLRAEWNPDFGEDAQPNYAPRYGMSYTQELGATTVKLRGSYGRSTRPPAPKLKSPVTYSEQFPFVSNLQQTISFFGNYNHYLANPDLEPEHQQGGEGGIELYFGARGSLVVTRYNQTVDGLISDPLGIDSARSIIPCPTPNTVCQADSRDESGYGYKRVTQYLNVGSIRNQGWELQGSVNAGPFTANGTYSWVKSRTIGVNPRYQSFFANSASYRQYQPGASFQYVPEHTWAFGMTYAQARSSVGVHLTGVGERTIRRDTLAVKYMDAGIRDMANRLTMTDLLLGRYVGFVSGNAVADLTASYRFISNVEGVLQVQNVTDRYMENERDGAYATMGRQSRIGVRIRTR